jgi:hypothetical protein
LCAAPAEASASLLGGLVKIVAGVLEVPSSIIAGTLQFPVVGTLAGALTGTVRGLGMVAQGALETVTGTVPIALKLLPFLPAVL